MNPSTRAALQCLLTLSVLTTGWVHSAWAQPSVRLNRFSPTELPQDGFHVSSAETPGHLGFGGQLYIDYSNDPLELEAARGTAGDVRFSLVEHQLTGNLGFHLGLGERVVAYAGLPIYIIENGDGIPAELSGSIVASGEALTPGNERFFPVHLADGFTVGDPYIGARVRVYGTTNDLFMMAVQGRITLPLAAAVDSSQHHAGEDGFSGHPELLLQLNIGRLRLMANVGAHIRPDVVRCESTTPQSTGPNARCFTGVSIGDELTFGLGATYALVGGEEGDDHALQAIVEIFGRTGARDPLGRLETPLEALLGVKYHHGSGLSAGVGGGLGLTSGYGTPDFRVLGTLGFARAGTAAEEPVLSADSDGDGIEDDVDACPQEPEDRDEFQDDDGCVDPDNDSDGVLDSNDGCPMEAEDADGFEDDNGCPDPDNDGDGIADADDGCANEAEDMDGFSDEDGCPDPDNDEDGVLDADDRCATEAGPAENRGCPWADTDGDGVVDHLDTCRTVPGLAEHGGCPEPQRLVLTENSIRILDKVYFATGRDVIQRRSFALLDNVARVLNEHPEITMLRVEGHTDSRGNAARNLSLSQRRAEAVMRYLIEHEVAEERLSAHGYGSERPIVENARTGAQHAQNRRVEFVVEHGDQHEAAEAEGEESPADGDEAADEETTGDEAAAPANDRTVQAADGPASAPAP